MNQGEIQSGMDTGPALPPGKELWKDGGPISKRLKTGGHDEGQFGSSQDKENNIGEMTETEETLADKLIPDVAIFYNDEMKRFLAEGLYDPTELREIHENLETLLTTQFVKVFDVGELQREQLKNQLSTLLDQDLPRHCQRNSENWKLKQARISKILQRMMSSYMEQIENVLLENPNGLENQTLEEERDIIIATVISQLEVEIRENVREQEPMEGHVNSLNAEINEYWECVVERNEENLEACEEKPDEDKPVLKNNDPVVPHENTFNSGSAPADDHVKQIFTPQTEDYGMAKVEASRELNNLVITTKQHIKEGKLYKFILEADLDTFLNVLESASNVARYQESVTLEIILEKIDTVNEWISKYKIKA